MHDKIYTSTSDKDVREASRPTSSRQAVLAEPAAYSPAIRQLYGVQDEEDDFDDIDVIALPFYLRTADRFVGPIPAWERHEDMASMYIRATDIPPGIMETQGAAFVSYASYCQAVEDWQCRMLELSEPGGRSSAWDALKNFRYWGVTSRLNSPIHGADRLFRSSAPATQSDEGSGGHSWLHWLLVFGNISQGIREIRAAQHSVQCARKNNSDEDINYVGGTDELNAFREVKILLASERDSGDVKDRTRLAQVNSYVLDMDELGQNSEPIADSSDWAAETGSGDGDDNGAEELVLDSDFYLPASSTASRAGGHPPLWFSVPFVSAIITAPVFLIKKAVDWLSPGAEAISETMQDEEVPMDSSYEHRFEEPADLASSSEPDLYTGTGNIYLEGNALIVLDKIPSSPQQITMHPRMTDLQIQVGYGPNINGMLTTEVVVPKARRGGSSYGILHVKSGDSTLQTFRFTSARGAIDKLARQIEARNVLREVTVVDPTEDFACDGDLLVILTKEKPAGEHPPLMHMLNSTGLLGFQFRAGCPELQLHNSTSNRQISIESYEQRMLWATVTGEWTHTPQVTHQIHDRWPSSTVINPRNMTIKRETTLRYTADYDPTENVCLTNEQPHAQVNVVLEGNAPLMHRVFTPDRGFLYAPEAALNQTEAGVIYPKGKYWRSIADAFDRMILETNPVSMINQTYDCPVSGFYRFYANTTINLNAPTLRAKDQDIPILELLGAHTILSLKFGPDYGGYMMRGLDGRSVRINGLYLGQIIPMLTVRGSSKAIQHIQSQFDIEMPAKTVRNPVGYFPVESKTAFVFGIDVDLSSQCEITLLNKPKIPVTVSFDPETLLQEGDTPYTYRFRGASINNIAVDTDDAEFITLFDDYVALSQRTVVVKKAEVRAKNNHRYVLGGDAYTLAQGEAGLAFNLTGVTEDVEFIFRNYPFHLSRNTALSNSTKVTLNDAGSEDSTSIALISDNAEFLDRQVKAFEQALAYDMDMPIGDHDIDSDKKIRFHRAWNADEVTRLNITDPSASISLEFRPQSYLIEGYYTNNSIGFASLDGRPRLLISCSKQAVIHDLLLDIRDLMRAQEVDQVEYAIIADQQSASITLDMNSPSKSILKVVDQRATGNSGQAASLVLPRDENGDLAARLVFPLHKVAGSPANSQFTLAICEKYHLIRSTNLLAQDLYRSYLLQANQSDQALFSQFERGNFPDDIGDAPLFNATAGATYELGKTPSPREEIFYIQGTPLNNFIFHPELGESVVIFLPDQAVLNPENYVDLTALAAESPFSLRSISSISSYSKSYQVANTWFFSYAVESYAVWHYLHGGREIDIVLIGRRAELEKVITPINIRINHVQEQITGLFDGAGDTTDSVEQSRLLLARMLWNLPQSIVAIMADLAGVDMWNTHLLQVQPQNVTTSAATTVSAMESVEEGFESLESTTITADTLEDVRNYLRTANSLVRARLEYPGATHDEWRHIAQRARKDDPAASISEMVNTVIEDTAKWLVNKRRYSGLLLKNAVTMVDPFGARQTRLAGHKLNYNTARLGYAGLFVRTSAEMDARNPDLALIAFEQTLAQTNDDLYSVELDYDTNQIIVDSKRHEKIRGSLDPRFTKKLRPIPDIVDLLENLTDEERRKFESAEMDSADAQRLLIRFMQEEGTGVPRPEPETRASYVWRMFKKRFGVFLDAGGAYGGLAGVELTEVSRLNKQERMKLASLPRRGFSVKSSAMLNGFLGEKDNNDWIQLTGDMGRVFVWPQAANGYFKDRYGRSFFGVEAKYLKKGDQWGRGMLTISGGMKTARAFKKWSDDPTDPEEFLHMIGEGMITTGDRTGNLPLKIKGVTVKFIGDLFSWPSDDDTTWDDIPDFVPGPKRFDIDLDSWRRQQGEHYINVEDFLRRFEENRANM